MNIKKLRVTAEVKFIIDLPEPTEITFWVRPIAYDRAQDLIGVGEASEALRKLVAEAIVDWDLEEDGKKLECNKENKEKYLDFLFRLRVKDENSSDDSSLLSQTILYKLFEFASRQENFFAR